MIVIQLFVLEFLNSKDGRWVIIQDWSQCTLSCGGGKQYLQRLCVPPKSGGLSCEGPNILEKDCNTFECPNYIEEETSESLPTVIKMQRFFNRPQRYEVKIISILLLFMNTNYGYFFCFVVYL